MKAKLLSTVAVASLGVFLMMDSRAALAKETCSIGMRDNMFGGGCRVEQGYRHGHHGEYKYRPRKEEVEVEDADREWDRDRKHGKRHDKHHGKRHGGKHHGGKHGGWGHDGGKGGHGGHRGGGLGPNAWVRLRRGPLRSRHSSDSGRLYSRPLFAVSGARANPVTAARRYGLDRDLGRPYRSCDTRIRGMAPLCRPRGAGPTVVVTALWHPLRGFLAAARGPADRCAKPARIPVFCGIGSGAGIWFGRPYPGAWHRAPGDHGLGPPRLYQGCDSSGSNGLPSDPVFRKKE